LLFAELIDRSGSLGLGSEDLLDAVEDGAFWKKPRINFWLLFTAWDAEDFFNSGGAFSDGVEGLAFAIANVWRRWIELYFEKRETRY